MLDWDLDGKTTLVVTEKFEIENGNESNSLAQLKDSNYRNSEARIGFNDHLLEHYWTSSKLLIETLMDKLGLYLQAFFRLNIDITQWKKIFDSWERPDFDAKNQLPKNWSESFSLNAMLLIVTFVEESKPVITEKHHFDNRDESFLITTFWKLWTHKFLM